MFVSLKENLFRLRLCDKHNFLQIHDIVIKEICINKKIKNLHHFEMKGKGNLYLSTTPALNINYTSKC